MFSVQMNHKLIVVLYICIASVCSVPMQQPYLPMQYGMQPQLPFLRQMTPNVPSLTTSPQQQPLVIVLPNTEAEDRNVNLYEQIRNLNSNIGNIDENKDAYIEPKVSESKNALVYLPEEGRFSLGQIILYNPFLPVEVNVPNKLSGWIKHILSFGWLKRADGQLVPLGGMKTLANRDQMPVVVVPSTGPVPV